MWECNTSGFEVSVCLVSSAVFLHRVDIWFAPCVIQFQVTSTEAADSNYRRQSKRKLFSSSAAYSVDKVIDELMCELFDG